ncbi:uncharacterized protein LOC111605495 isoform X3 [Drosophila hydei]|uniref:Uncharacterized protein LOC111605495 isoform X3 n=1 Tax=Drosophila hydei TaxID=7224 RepID=A0A6J1MK72_DROHY|nr:uncharacterized protein LOC111605495 isoform X3 [Drosophila hydei]
MFGNRFVAVVLVASCSLAQAYPALLPYLYSPLKRSAAAFPQIEDDVVELDQLRQEQPVAGKRQHDGSTARTTTTTTKESIEKVIAPPEAGSKEQQQQHLMPDLERQLEVATPLMSMSTTTTTSTSATTTTAAFKDEGERSQLEEPKTAAKPANEPGAHAKTAQSLLRNPNGQYSSFDMAQYVFWTGDETGVARAVEELIDENLITREGALKFLRDIRLGIEFLQRSYANRIFPEELRQNHLKRNTLPSSTTTSTTTTTTTSTTTEKPFMHLDADAEAVTPEIGRGKSLDSFTFWNKLKALESETPQDLTDYDETMGRAKIVEYLYNEYSLEEILYKLAKVMFAQSLAHGSDEAQQELQKLTEFLEHEGNLGIIPVDLQKKVLRVLLTALSDTLTEHPELLPAARVNLANPFFRFPMHSASK